MPIYHAEPTIIESLSDQEIVVAGPLNELHFVAEKIDMTRVRLEPAPTSRSMKTAFESHDNPWNPRWLPEDPNWEAD